MQPIISVVVPVYNIEQRIEYMIHSLTEQDFDDFEVIFVDDASTDDSVKIISKYFSEARANKYKIISHQINRGVSAARNTGLYESSGKYVVFVDGDDMLEPQFLSGLYHALSSGDYEFASCGYKTFDIGSGTKVLHPLDVPNGISRDDLLAGRILNKIGISHWATLFRREFLTENGLCFYEGCGAGEDIEFLIKVLCRCSRPVFISECLYIYVQHHDMGSRREIHDKTKRLARYMEHTEAHFREAEYIKRYTQSERLHLLADSMLIPQAYLRTLSSYAMNGDVKNFYREIHVNEVRKALRCSYKSLRYKPEVFLRSLVALLAPSLYYKKYSHYLDR